VDPELNRTPPTAEEVAFIRRHASLVELKDGPRIKIDHSYFKIGLKGTSPRMFTREAVALRLHDALSLLPKDYGIIVFDAFRTIDCQWDLLRWMKEEVSRRNPALSPDQALETALLYVANPADQDRPTVPTHNSGGAIDLGLARLRDGEWKLVPFGTPFDEPIPLSEAVALERPYDPASGLSEEAWTEARANRRLLFHVMQACGFTCLKSEWWHYDLGDFLWSRTKSTTEHPVPWIFESLEPEVRKAL
jgi:zinc D-Ala-D-Ala dipeptidase